MKGKQTTNEYGLSQSFLVHYFILQKPLSTEALCSHQLKSFKNKIHHKSCTYQGIRTENYLFNKSNTKHVNGPLVII